MTEIQRLSTLSVRTGRMVAVSVRITTTKSPPDARFKAKKAETEFPAFKLRLFICVQNQTGNFGWLVYLVFGIGYFIFCMWCFSGIPGII